MNGDIFFLSDAHIRPLRDPGEREKQAQLVAFLRWLRGRAGSLVIAGDLFDFWFEYRSTVPARGGRVLAALADLADAGTAVTLLGGNHDWWIGGHLTAEYGIAVSHGPISIAAQGKRIYVAHGDRESHAAIPYTIVRRVIRSRLAIGAFRFLHPDVSGALVDFVARRSRERSDAVPPDEQTAPVYDRLATRVLAAGYDVAVFGHVHAARLVARPDGLLVVLGDWVTQGTYGQLHDGRFLLRTWRAPGRADWPADPREH